MPPECYMPLVSVFVVVCLLLQILYMCESLHRYAHLNSVPKRPEVSNVHRAGVTEL